MKKATIVFTLVALCVSPLFSQYRNYTNDEHVFDYTSNFYRWGLYGSAEANQTIIITGKNKKGKIVSVKTNQFNDDTLVILDKYVDGKGKEKSNRLSIFDGRHLTAREIYKKGKLKYKTKNTFDDRYKTSYTKFDAKGSIIEKNENTFTEKEYVTFTMNKKSPVYKGKKLKSTTTYKKGGEKQRNKFIYEYNDEGKQTLTTFYNAKNDVKYVWDYSCKDEGELLASKNETNFCKWQEDADGMLIIVTRKTSPKGKIEKTVKKYDADTNKVASETYIDDVLTQKVVYDKVYSKPLIWENYKKGVLRNKYLYVYAEDGKVLNTKSYYKDMEHVSFEEKYTYEKEQLIAVEHYSKGQLIRSYAIGYN